LDPGITANKGAARPLNVTDRPSKLVAGKTFRLSRSPKFKPKTVAIDPGDTGVSRAKLAAFTTDWITGKAGPATGSRTVLLVFPPISSESGWFPAGRPGGSVKETRYRPMAPGSGTACGPPALCLSTITVVSDTGSGPKPVA
jgi:hypothetical protein